jgi:hypothetical protein
VKPLAVAAAALALRLWLIFQFPIIFGGDSMVRLLNRDRILLSHQLPLLQFLMWTVTRVTTGIVPIRLMMACLGALAAVAFYYFARDFAGPAAAVAGALLFATNPFITPISTVPYQEILLLGTLLAAFHFFFARRWMPAAIFLGLACLTRFEAWIACPILGGAWFLDGPKNLRRAAAAVALFAPVPIAWILFRRGLAPEGSYVLEHTFTLARFSRLTFLGAYTVRETPIPELLLAAVGLALLFRDGHWGDRRWRLLGAYLMVFGIAILFSAHGDFPDPERYVTTREIHIPLAIVTLLATVAIARFPRAGLVLAAAGVVLGVWGSIAYTRHETARPEMRLGYDLARFLDSHVQPGEQVLILAQPPNFELHFRKALETGGESGLAAARRAVEQDAVLPLDAQRTVVHLSRIARSQIFAFPQLPARADWVAVWSDFSPANSWSDRAREHPDATLRVSDRAVVICRLR